MELCYGYVDIHVMTGKFQFTATREEMIASFSSHSIQLENHIALLEIFLLN
jgi:hypothetical protein